MRPKLITCLAVAAAIALIAGLGYQRPPAAQASGSFYASKPNHPFTLSTVDRMCFFAPSLGGSWPLRNTVHAIRGGLNESRGRGVHFGMDVPAARDHQRVYAIQSGVLWSLRPHHFKIGDRSHYYFYWHVVPDQSLREGQYIRRGQLLGRIFFNSYHVHVSEYYDPCGFINPYRPDAPLALPRNREAPSIGDLQARRGLSSAWPRLQLGNRPPRGSDPSQALSLESVHGRVDFRASILDHPTTHIPHFPEQIPQPVAAIRGWVAPPHNQRRHLGPMHVWDGARVFKLRADRSNLFHLWSWGTWRSNGCYFTDTGICGQDLVYHLGGYWGFDTRRLRNHAYQFCVAALTINNVKARRCTRFWVNNG